MDGDLSLGLHSGLHRPAAVGRKDHSQTSTRAGMIEEPDRGRQPNGGRCIDLQTRLLMFSALGAEKDLPPLSPLGHRGTLQVPNANLTGS